MLFLTSSLLREAAEGNCMGVIFRLQPVLNLCRCCRLEISEAIVLLKLGVCFPPASKKKLSAAAAWRTTTSVRSLFSGLYDVTSCNDNISSGLDHKSSERKKKLLTIFLYLFSSKFFFSKRLIFDKNTRFSTDPIVEGNEFYLSGKSGDGYGWT